MSAGFTPGPWRIEPHAKFGDTQMYWVNDFTSVGTGIKPDVVLIAASPDLYEAAEALLRDANARADLFNARCRDLRVALAKARGEQVSA